MPVMSQHRHLGSVQRPLRHFLNQIQIKARDETNKNRKGRTIEQDSEKKKKNLLLAPTCFTVSRRYDVILSQAFFFTDI